MLLTAMSLSFRDRAGMPALPVLVVDGPEVLPVVPLLDAVPLQDIGHSGAAAVALVDLVDRQPGLDVLLRLPLEDPLAAVRARLELLALVLALPLADGRRVARLGEDHRDLADLAELGQPAYEGPPAVRDVLALLVPHRLVVLLERPRIRLGKPLLVLFGGDARGERRSVGELVERPVDLVGEDLLLRDRILDVPWRLDAVEGEVREEPLQHLLLKVELEGLLPAHHLARQHVVQHLRDQGGDPVSAPEPLVDPPQI